MTARTVFERGVVAYEWIFSWRPWQTCPLESNGGLETSRQNSALHVVSKEALWVYQTARIHSSSLAKNDLNDQKPYAPLAHMSPLQLPMGFAFEVKNRTHYKPMVYSYKVKNGLLWAL